MRSLMIKHLIMDVDGSLTDGKIYIGPNGEAMKAFSVKDGFAINTILRNNKIEPIILTARESSIVENRCKEIGIKKIHQGISNKLNFLKTLLLSHGLNSSAYFGDDITDLDCMLLIKEEGGVVGCPADAAREVKVVSDYICFNKAGNGALREFVEWLVAPKLDLLEMSRKINFAFDHLQRISLQEVSYGNEVFVNDEFYYTVLNYKTIPENKAKLESHREYAEIQIVIGGQEYLDITDVSRLTPVDSYNIEKDTQLWNAPSRMSRLLLKTGSYIVLYPENAYRCAISVNDKLEEVIKIVGRVKLS